MQKKRSYLIDNLRGLSVIGMILIHTNVYYLSNRLVYQLWNWSQFVVPLFIYCSAYLYFSKTKQTTILEKKSFPTYLKKRLPRLLIPYYIYLVFFLILQFLTEHQLSWQLIIRRLTLTTLDNDISWLILLFLCLTLLFPAIDYLALKKRLLFFCIIIISYLSAIYLLFFHSPVHFKVIMWLPWLIIVIATWFIVRIERSKRQLVAMVLLSALMFISTYWYKVSLHQSLSFYNNKYPPNIYYLSYGLFMMTILTLLLNREVFPPGIKWFVYFMSKYSYSIFFIHFLILFTIIGFKLLKYFQWYSLFLAILVVTVVIQLTINYFFSMLKKAN